MSKSMDTIPLTQSTLPKHRPELVLENTSLRICFTSKLLRSLAGDRKHSIPHEHISVNKRLQRTRTETEMDSQQTSVTGMNDSPTW